MPANWVSRIEEVATAPTMSSAPNNSGSSLEIHFGLILVSGLSF
jgi:hypothetical protein